MLVVERLGGGAVSAHVERRRHASQRTGGQLPLVTGVTLLGLRLFGRAPEHRLQPFEHYAALISRILNLSVPRGAETSTVSPFLWPMIALPTGDSFDSLLAAGSASAEPT